MEKLFSEHSSINQLNVESIEAMYSLFANYYDGSDIEGFSRDLLKKSNVLIIYNENKDIVGFTTILHYLTYYQGQQLQVIFSGDTIMAEKYWGNFALAFNWIKFAGTLKASHPHLPLYWFIIVKGHRTYRYLPVFSKIFYPNHEVTTPSFEQGLMDSLAMQAYGEYYDTSKGIIHFPKSQGHLKHSFAEIPTQLLNRKEIQFFINKNPYYAQGDELVCICKLEEENLKPLSRRLFKEGLLKSHVSPIC